MKYVFFDMAQHENVYDINPILYVYYNLNSDNGYLKGYHNLMESLYNGWEFLLLLVEDDNQVAGFIRYGLKNLFNHSVLHDIFLKEEYYNVETLQYLLEAFEKERGSNKFCVISTLKNNPLWREYGFVQTTYTHKNTKYFLDFYTAGIKEICDLNVIYSKSPFLVDETIGDYYFRMHQHNRKKHKRLFFTSLFCAGSMSPFVLFLLLSVLFYANPTNITFLVIFTLIELFGVYMVFQLKTHKKHNDYIFGFHYIQLLMNNEIEYIK